VGLSERNAVKVFLEAVRSYPELTTRKGYDGSTST